MSIFLKLELNFLLLSFKLYFLFSKNLFKNGFVRAYGMKKKKAYCQLEIYQRNLVIKYEC